MFEQLVADGFQVEFHSHAKAILSIDFPIAVSELDEILARVSIPIAEIVGSGGGETKATQRLRHALAAAHWKKTNFVIDKVINGVRRESQSHEVDHVRQCENGVVALEIEWNNKDPFFDRDLENFKRLHAEGAISVGVIVTRGVSLQDRMTELIRRFAAEHAIDSFDKLAALGLNPTPRQKLAVESRTTRGVSFAEAWAAPFVADKFGQATTHWRKLADRVRRGVGNPCPLLLIGLPASVVSFESQSDR